MCFVSSLVWSFFICCTFGLRLSLKGRSLRWCHTWHGVGMWGISVRTPYIPLRPPAPLLKLLTACANTFFWTKTKKMEVWMNRKSGICSWEFPTVKHFPHPPIVAEAGTRHVLHSILELGSSLWGSGTTDTRAGRVRYGSLWIAMDPTQEAMIFSIGSLQTVRYILLFWFIFGSIGYEKTSGIDRAGLCLKLWVWLTNMVTPGIDD